MNEEQLQQYIDRLFHNMGLDQLTNEELNNL